MFDDLLDATEVAPCFAHSKPPIAGESLLGFVARNCEVHGISKVAAALRPAGLEGNVTEYLATAHADKAQAIAALFATTEAEVRSRMYLPVTMADDRPGGYIDFHGIPLRRDLLQFQCRRISPAGLRTSAHHRAVWDVHVFPFCPDAREMLISTCPTCDGVLGWRWTHGIGCCEGCGEDLTRVEGTPVTCADIEALGFVCGLIHPDAARRGQARAMVPGMLSPLSNGDLFEMAIQLACVVLTGGGRRLFRPRTAADFLRFMPDVLAKAGRLLLGWPDSMHAFADDLRAQAGSRPGYWGALKDLAPLVVVASRRETLAPLSRRLLRDMIRDDVGRAGSALRRTHRRTEDLMTVSEAYEQFGFSKATLRKLRNRGLIQATFNAQAERSIVLVRRDEIARMAREQEDVISRIDVSRALGVDHLAVGRLADAGLLQAVSPAIAALLVGDHYRRSSMDALADRLLAKADPEVAGTMAVVPLAKAAAELTQRVVPWVGLTSAVLSGDLAVRMVQTEAGRPVTERLGVAQSVGLRTLIASLDEETLPDYGDGRMNTHEAAAILGVPASVMTHLTQGGHLPATDDASYRLQAADVIAFHATYVSNQEVARRSGRPGRQIVPELLTARVPVFSPDPAGKTRFWDRRAAEAAMIRWRK